MKFPSSILFISGLSLLISSSIIFADEYIPREVKYSDREMWYFIDNDTLDNGADIFYIPSTWEFDWYTADSLVSHYADPSLERHREHMGREMKGFVEIMGDDNRFYSPFYRHVTLNTWATLNEDYIDSLYFNVSFKDVCNAFDFYLRENNSGRPFVLAGFSQGAKSVIELIKVLPDTIRPLMVAAYVIGYKVTPEDTTQCRYIIPAKGEFDTGVTICYNSVEDVKYIKPLISLPNVACINPVNWSTQGETAFLNDSVTVTLDPDMKVLVVKGYDASKYKPVLNFINTGDLHSADPWIYKERLQSNVRERINCWKNLQEDGSFVF